MNIGFIGGGRMAEALIQGLFEHGAKDISVAEPLDDRRNYLASMYDVKTTASNGDVSSSCSVLILAVKPQHMNTVVDEIVSSIPAETIVISIAAGITLASLSSKLKHTKVVRAMPNMPALVQEGMTIVSLGEGITQQDSIVVNDLFSAIGKVLMLPEGKMNAMMTISGCGPAFFTLFLEAMVKAGSALGLADDVVLASALQTFIGTARLLEVGIAPEEIRAMVTSPGGATAEGIKAFQGLDDLVVGALQAARHKADELGKA